MTQRSPSAPPRLALLLVQSLVPESEREVVLGDLVEQYQTVRLPQLGAARADMWFWRETVAACVQLRLRERSDSVATGDSFAHSFLADFRHGLRLLRRSPMFTLLSILTLGLATGAATAVFSVANPLILRPLPYPRADRLAMIWELDTDGSPSNTSFATYTDLSRARTLERAAAIGWWQPSVSEGGDAERLDGARVSWTYFGVIGVAPALGRDFVAGEDAPDVNRVVILSHGLWSRRFGSDSTIVARSILIDGVAHAVAGVMPAGFEDPIIPTRQIWRVLGYDASQPSACRTCRHISMIARTREGARSAEVSAELDQLSARLVSDYPQDYPAAGTHVVPLQREMTDDMRPVVYALLGAVALVLLIAVANVTSLQLARAARRKDEFAMRMALGAGRRRLARQLLAEALGIALLGGAAGLLVAKGTLTLLLSRLPATLPRLAAMHLDLDTFAVAVAITVGVALAVGLAPAWGRAIQFDTLRDGGRIASRVTQRMRSGLVVAEIALALMLMIGAGLLGHSLLRLLSVDPGFPVDRLLTLEIQATGPKYEEDDAVYANHDQIRRAVSALPGVVGVGITSQLPLGGNVDGYGIHAEDKPLPNPALAPSADRYVVSPDFTTTMGIPIVAGRGFDVSDGRSTTAPVVIVSAALAERVWPNENALGKRIRMGGPDSPLRTVVGVAGNIRHHGLHIATTHQAYVPERQWLWSDNQVTLVVRSRNDVAALIPAVRAAIRTVDSSQPIMRVASMENVIAASLAQRRLALALFALFAGIALILAVAGIYGVLSGRVSERTREIGLRSALGARTPDILKLVLRDGMKLAVLGLAFGLVGTFALSRFMIALLFGVTPGDPPTIAAVTTVLALVAFAACLAPAIRALRVQPMKALRAE